MQTYADVIEMNRPLVRNYAFVRRVIEMKRMSVNAKAKLRLRLVDMFALVRDSKVV